MTTYMDMARMEGHIRLVNMILRGNPTAAIVFCSKDGQAHLVSEETRGDDGLRGSFIFHSVVPEGRDPDRYRAEVEEGMRVRYTNAFHNEVCEYLQLKMTLWQHPFSRNLTRQVGPFELAEYVGSETKPLGGFVFQEDIDFLTSHFMDQGYREWEVDGEYSHIPRPSHRGVDPSEFELPRRISPVNETLDRRKQQCEFYLPSYLLVESNTGDGQVYLMTLGSEIGLNFCAEKLGYFNAPICYRADQTPNEDDGYIRAALYDLDVALRLQKAINDQKKAGG